MNPSIERLHAYPFEKLAQLKAGVSTNKELPHIALSIGEPQHDTPSFVCDVLAEHLPELAKYPTTRGLDELRGSIADWLIKRFRLPGHAIDPNKHILPVNGTREALFAFAQACVDRRVQPMVVMPNPFYQIYEGAAILAGAEPWFLNTTAKHHFDMDFAAVPEAVWQRCQLIYVCSPGNPTGRVLPRQRLAKLIELADRFDFVIAADECYSEIYPDEDNPPVGLLEVCSELGRVDFERCVVFHSLSKRSNLPGLRSGFVAGDAKLLDRFLRYRTYHGCAMSLPAQRASIAAWNDEDHVLENRRLYREKFAAVLPILQPVLDVQAPDASFYLWPKTPIPDTEFAKKLFAAKNVTVLPGSFLSRDSGSGNPGAGHVRMALVASVDECVEAAWRIRAFVEAL